MHSPEIEFLRDFKEDSHLGELFFKMFYSNCCEKTSLDTPQNSTAPELTQIICFASQR